MRKEIFLFGLANCAVPAFLPGKLWGHMRVDETIRKCAVFIGVETGGKFIPLGTGFVAGVPYEDVNFQFVVTAQHVIDDCVRINPKHFSIRLNRKDGTAEVLKIDADTTHFGYNDRALDFVMFAYGFDPAIYDFTAISLDSENWTGARNAVWEPGPGDEVCVVGLYTTHYGSTKNIPVIRVGHIATMPDEKVATHRGFVHGYLMEVHSIAGLSGSPVFLNVPQVRVKEGEIQSLKTKLYIPLGIMIGYHAIEATDDEIPVPQFQPEEGLETVPPEARPSTEERRTGLCVVIPIESVFGLIKTDPFQQRLKEALVAFRKQSGFRTASALPVVASEPQRSEASANEANPNAREDFTSLLNAAARKPKQDG